MQDQKIRKRSRKKDTKILEAKNITKRFGGLTALDKVDFYLKENEILALLGDNGAGKSTFIKVIAGMHSDYEGNILVDGEEVDISSPQDSKRLGIETLYQNLALFDALNIPTNLFMNQELKRGWNFFLDKKPMYKLTREVLGKLDITVKSIKQKVGNLSGGQQHAVAIGRAVYIGSTPRIVIMDEPTAGLGVEESRKLLEIIRELADREISVILISHNLDHVFKVADRAMVLRSGKLVGERDIEKTSHEEITQMMLGSV